MIEVFRTPDARFEGLPGWPFEPRYAEVDGLRMHYVDEGAGQPVVMFHGEPSWCYLYRKMIPPVVASGRRAVAPDLAGFGRSDKPVDFGWYSYDRHFEHVSEVLASWTCRTPSSSCRTGAGRSGCAGRWTMRTVSRRW